MVGNSPISTCSLACVYMHVHVFANIYVPSLNKLDVQKHFRPGGFNYPNASGAVCELTIFTILKNHSSFPYVQCECLHCMDTSRGNLEECGNEWLNMANAWIPLDVRILIKFWMNYEIGLHHTMLWCIYGIDVRFWHRINMIV